MAQKPYKSGVLNAIYERANRPAAVKAITPRQAPLVRYAPGAGPRPRKPELFVSSELQTAIKSLPYSQYVQDFVNDTGGYTPLYTEEQLEQAYRTSVYLFAAMRKVASLMNEVVIRAEVQRGGEWERLPETHHLNRVFSDAGARFLFDLYIYYALYGSVLIYKRKTRKALYAWHRGKPLTGYLDGAIAGFHVIPNANWTLRENSYSGDIEGFDLLVQDDQLGQRTTLDPRECIYIHDFDPRRRNDGTSMASLAINNAVTNAAIARWAAHYFMSGAMPLLLVNIADSDNYGTESDYLQYKNLVERIWQGLWGKFSLRAVFTDRKLEANPVGIEAEKVQAPELNQDALNAIASVFQIAPDLIVPPAGGSDNARHKHLQMAAYYDAVIPVAKWLVAGFEEGMKLTGSNVRLVVAEDEIRALEADRAEVSDTEISVFNAGLQTYGESQERLRSKPIAPLKDFILINGKFQSVERVLREDKIVSSELLQYAAQGWNDGALRLGEYRKLLFDLDTPPDLAAKFKYEVVPDSSSGGFPSEDSAPPPDAPEPPPDGGGAPPAPQAQPPAAPAPVEEAPAPQIRQADENTADGEAVKIVEEVPEADAPAEAEADEVTLESGSAVTVLVEGDDETAALITRDAPEPEGLPNPAYVVLDVSGDSLLHTARNDLARALGTDAPVQWSDPATWHCTLFHTPDIDDERLRLARRLLPSHLEQMSLAVGQVSTFDTPEGTCIVLLVEPDDALAALQAKVRAAFEAQRAVPGEFSQSGAFNPHITLGYAPPEFLVPEFHCRFLLYPQRITIGRDGYQLFEEIPHIRSIQAAAADHFEPDGTGEVVDPNARHHVETLEAEMHRRRKRIQQALDFERENIPALLEGTHVSETIPADILNAMRDAWQMMPLPKDAGRVYQAALEALARGEFDFDSQSEENPILKRLEQHAEQDTAEDELRAWMRAALRSSKKALERFEIKRLPLAVEQQVREALPATTTKAAVREVFDAALLALQDAQAVKDTDEAVFGEWVARLQQDETLRHLVEIGNEGQGDE